MGEKQKARLGGVGLGWKWLGDFADYAVTMLRRAQEGSQTFLTAISLMVASQRRMAAEWFKEAVDAEVCRGVQI